MDRDEICSRFLETIEYDLYPFQEEALPAWFEAEGGILVTAPTGMGKTLIAKAAIFEAVELRRPPTGTTTRSAAGKITGAEEAYILTFAQWA